MKKITFFLSALLISVMSFAADYPATNTSNVSFTLGTKAYDSKIVIEGTEYQAIKLGTGSAIGDMSFTVPANTAKIHLHIAGWNGKASAVTISASNGVTLGTTEITATSDAGINNNSPYTLSDVTKVTSDYYHVIELTSPTTEETTITIASIKNKYRVVIWGVNAEEVASGEQGETVDAPTFSATEANFTEAFNLTITSAEGTTLKYTTDKTDPTTSETAVVVESNTATVAISAKSTMVKAVAVKGELVSNVKSMTYCYVNSEATAYTVTEALAIYNEGLGLSNKLYIKGSVKSIEDLNTEYGNATYTITDGESDLYIYRGKNFGGEKFTSADQLFVDDDLVLYGQLTSYNGNPQVAANSEIISRESKTKSILAEDLTFDAIALGDEVEAQTLTVTGANLTAEITATLDNEKFTVTPATLPAAGGDLTIAPAADLTVGEHAATLTLTSGETTNEVTLSILVKDVYAIEWYVNGEIYDETTVVEGDKLVLPEAPEAPEACSEKVFVGWTAAEEVNADGSDIEWVTAATLPTAAATYYAVFAAQEGEGGASEVVDVLNRALTGAEGTNYASWADVSATSTAVYAGQSAGGNDAIQLRSNNSNSGVISTTSGGKLAKITVTWNSNTISGRTLNVYGSNTAYASPTDLYGDASGEKLGAIVCGTSTELVIEGDYAYVGLRSNSGAMYLDEIQITWIAGAAATYTDYSTTCEPEIPTYTVTVVDAAVSTGTWSIDLAGTWEERTVTIKLWQDNVQGFGEYAANAETGYTCQLGNPYAELTPTTVGLYADNGDGTFTFTATMTDTDGGIYNISVSGDNPVVEPETKELEGFTAFAKEEGSLSVYYAAEDWSQFLELYIENYTGYGEYEVSGVYYGDVTGDYYGMSGSVTIGYDEDAETDVLTATLTTSDGSLIVLVTLYDKAATMPLMITNLRTEQVGAYLQLTGRNDMDDADVMLFLNDYTGEDKAYEVDTENSLMTYGGIELTVLDGSLTKSVDPEYGDMFTGVVNVYAEEDDMSLALELTMYAAPATNVVVVNAVATYDDNTGALTLTGLWEDAEVSVEIAGYDGKESVEYNTPQGIKFETPDVIAFGNEASITVAGEDITVVCTASSWTGDVFNVTITTLAQVNTALGNVTTTVAPVKAIVNGQLVILKDGVQYNAQGAVIK